MIQLSDVSVTYPGGVTALSSTMSILQALGGAASDGALNAPDRRQPLPAG